MAYRDEGCELATSCLNCPFPRCHYDDPVIPRKARNALRNAEILRLLREEHMAVPDIAEHCKVSESTVYRIRLKIYQNAIQEEIRSKYRHI